LYISGGDHGDIIGNEFRDADISGIYVGDSEDQSDDLLIAGNYVHDNGTHANQDHGIYVGHAANGTIVNNVVERNHAHGIMLAPQAEGMTVAYNTVVANGRSGILVGGDDTQTSNDNIIVSNIVSSNADWGIRTFWESLVGVGNVARSNLVAENGRGAFWFPRGGMFQHDAIFANPQFETSDNGLYDLADGSPAVDSGVSEYAPASDYEGKHRDAAPDAGAFER